MPLSGASVAYSVVGGLILFSGIKGSTISDTVKAALTGNLTVTNTEELSNSNATVVSGATVSGSASGAAIANDALRYVGRLKYVFGGTPGPSGSGPVDCSSFVSLVLGKDLGLSIPGGSWASQTDNGSAHGPVTTDFLSWQSATTIPANECSAGVLCCWSTHVAIAISNSACVSALNPRLGVVVTTISTTGPVGESVTYRRLNSVHMGCHEYHVRARR
jgi:cell wall-associated NlpC family hydrolase